MSLKCHKKRFYIFYIKRFFLLRLLNYWSNSPDHANIFVDFSGGGGMGEKMWPSELVWYDILFQSYTITHWNHITAPNWGSDNLLKGTIPSEGQPLTPGSAGNLSQDDSAVDPEVTWANTHTHTYTRTDTLSPILSFFCGISILLFSLWNTDIFECTCKVCLYKVKNIFIVYINCNKLSNHNQKCQDTAKCRTWN